MISANLNFQSYGSGHPLIILHGLFGSLDNCRTFAKDMGNTLRVFIPDLRNHGRSPRHDVFNYPVMADDLKLFMEQQQISSAYLMGHSMGGKVAMQFAETYPRKIDKLIVADIAPRAYPPWHSYIFDALLPLDLSLFSSRKEIDRAIAPKIECLPLRMLLLKNVMRDKNRTFRWKIHLEAIHRNYNEIGKAPTLTRKFRQPAMFVKGGQSDYIRPEDEERIRQFYPNAQMTVIENANHWLHVDDPRAFFRAVWDFLLPGTPYK